MYLAISNENKYIHNLVEMETAVVEGEHYVAAHVLINFRWIKISKK